MDKSTAERIREGVLTADMLRDGAYTADDLRAGRPPKGVEPDGGMSEGEAAGYWRLRFEEEKGKADILLGRVSRLEDRNGNQVEVIQHLETENRRLVDEADSARRQVRLLEDRVSAQIDEAKARKEVDGSLADTARLARENRELLHIHGERLQQHDEVLTQDSWLGLASWKQAVVDRIGGFVDGPNLPTRISRLEEQLEEALEAVLDLQSRLHRVEDAWPAGDLKARLKSLEDKQHHYH